MSHIIVHSREKHRILDTMCDWGLCGFSSAPGNTRNRQPPSNIYKPGHPEVFWASGPWTLQLPTPWLTDHPASPRWWGRPQCGYSLKTTGPNQKSPSAQKKKNRNSPKEPLAGLKVGEQVTVVQIPLLLLGVSRGCARSRNLSSQKTMWESHI